MQERIRFGIVGCGRIALRHASCLNDIHNAELIAVTDIVRERAVRIAQEFDCLVEPNISSLLARNDIDVISICTPSGLHAHLGIEAAKAGKHVLVEKPLAISLETADSLIEACKRAEVKLAVVLQNRFNPVIRKLRHAFEQGHLGELLLGAAGVRWFRPQSYYEDEWHGQVKMGGGVLMNQAVHFFDMIQWFFGMPESVFAHTATLAHKAEVEDTGIVVMKFPNNSLCTVEASTITYPNDVEGSLSLFGTKGYVQVGGKALNQLVTWGLMGELEQNGETPTWQSTQSSGVYGTAHRLIIEDMMDAILNNREPAINGVEGRKSVELITKAYESAFIGRSI